MAWIMLLLLQGCAAFTAPDAALPSPGERLLPPGASAAVAVEREFTGHGGARLGYMSYTADGATTALVYLHGIESHAGWFAPAAERLRALGYDVHCLDRRGSGINRENRGFTSGHVDAYETLLADLEAFIAPLRSRYRAVYLVGLSWGGKLALAYTLDHPEDVRGLILITPGLESLVDVSTLDKVKIAALTPVWPTATVPTPIEPEMFTTTPSYLDYIRRDPLRLTEATVRFFWQSTRLDRHNRDRMAGNRVPILLFLADQDRIIDNQGVRALLARGAQDTLDVLEYRGQTHSIQFDATERMVDDMHRWIRRRGRS